MKPKTTHPSLEKRLASYGAMSLAAAAGFSAMPAQANTIVFTNPSSLAGNSTATGPVFFTPVSGNAGFELFRSVMSSPGLSSSCGPVFAGPGHGCMSSRVNLAGNGGNKVEVNAAYGYVPEVLIAGDNGGNSPYGYSYVGLSFTNGDYGWAEIDVTGPTNVELVGFAYDVVASQYIAPGQTQNNLTVPGGGGGGSTPEPGTLVLLALGAAGVAVLRRRKQNVAAAE